MLSSVVFLLFTTAQAIVVAGPSGPWSVSYSARELVDESRWDPYAPEDSPHRRRIMTSVFVPVQECETHTVDYLPPVTREVYKGVAGGFGLPPTVLDDLELEVCSNATQPTQPCSRHPVVIFSPGFSGLRLLSTAQAMSLASRGYVVVTVDHPYEATVVEFPDGTVIRGFNLDDASDENGAKAIKVRTEDVVFLIDQLFDASGSLGSELEGLVDLDKIFLYGHSLGGATAAAVSLIDDRVAGGLDLDGKIFSPVAEVGLDTPFFLVGPEIPANQTEHLRAFIGKLRGPRSLINVAGTTHNSFFDFPLILALRDDIPPELQPIIDFVLGSIDGERLAVVVDDVLGAAASFVFEGKSDICHLEEAEELSVIEQDLGDLC